MQKVACIYLSEGVVVFLRTMKVLLHKEENIMRRIISFFLLIAILIVEATPNTVFATENNIARTEEEALELLRRNNNFAKLERVAEILSSQSTEMETHVWIGDALYAVYKTDDPKVKLTLSGTEFQAL